jgi:hypothetical protein
MLDKDAGGVSAVQHQTVSFPRRDVRPPSGLLAEDAPIWAGVGFMREA